MNKENNKKIDEILASLDGCQKAAAPDFLYTRLKAKMLSQQEKEGSSRTSFPKYKILRPAYAFAALILVLLINATVLLNSGHTTLTSDNDEDMQTVVTEYNMNDNAILFDLNSEK